MKHRDKQPDDEHLETELRQAFQACKRILQHDFDSGICPEAVVSHYCNAIDNLIQLAWQEIVAPPSTGLTLVAVGGYGRGELMPASDIDLMILLDQQAEADYGESLSAFLTMLWDIGLEVGHSVRSVEDCVLLGKDDITIATNLMESRLLAGDSGLYARMKTVTGPDQMWDGKAFFQAKLEEQRKRHLKFGETAYNLEPNIKENPGGLRDIQMIGWVAKRHYGCETLEGLLVHGFLTEQEYHTLMAGQAFLWRLRIALHLHTGRREDRLLFDHQHTLAGLFGYQQNEDNTHMAVELFMRDYYRWVMELNRLNDLLLSLFKEQILYADEAPDPTPINRRFQSRSRFIEVTHPGVFERYPFALLEIFLLLAQNDRLEGVRAATIRLIRQHHHLIDEDFRNDLRCRALFMELIRQPHGVTHELRRMNRYGVLAAYIPAFANIVGQMQYDLFHAYTVDEHTLFVVRNIRRFTVPEFAAEAPFAHELINTVPKQELLILAALFHDIAKGRGGDHSALGAEDALHFCHHHGLSEYDSKTVAWLVRNHLLMSSTAQKRDISDPAVIHEFATQIKNRDRLSYLYLLTVADMRGTNPEIWNSWKASLLMELYNLTARALRRGLEHPLKQIDIIRVNRKQALEALLEDGYRSGDIESLWNHFADEYFLRHSSSEIVWHTQAILDHQQDPKPLVLIRPSEERGSTEIFIYAKAYKGLFEGMNALLAQQGLNVVDARILTSSDQYVLDSYSVLDDRGHPITEENNIQALLQTLQQGLQHPERIKTDVTKRQPRKFRHFPIPTQIEFSLDESNQRTIIELFAEDRPGLLCGIGKIFTACEIQLENARISTYGSRAEDVFYVTDKLHQPVEDHQQLKCVRDRIKQFLA